MTWELVQHVDRGDGVSLCGRARGRFVAQLDVNGCQLCQRTVRARQRPQRVSLEARLREALQGGERSASSLAREAGVTPRRVRQVLAASGWAVRRGLGRGVVWGVR